jgi:hypothetical protein
MAVAAALAVTAFLLPSRVETPVAPAASVAPPDGEPLPLRLDYGLLPPESRRKENQDRK